MVTSLFLYSYIFCCNNFSLVPLSYSILYGIQSLIAMYNDVHENALALSAVVCFWMPPKNQMAINIAA